MNDFKSVLEIAILICNVGAVVVGLYVRGEIKDLRSHIYEHFLTKDDFEKLFKR